MIEHSQKNRSTSVLRSSTQLLSTVRSLFPYVLSLLNVSLSEFFLQELGGSQALIAPLIRAHIAATLVDGEFWIAEERAEGRVVGVALWFGPKTDFLSRRVLNSSGPTESGPDE